MQLWVPKSLGPAPEKLEYYIEDSVWDFIHKPWCKMNSTEGESKKKLTNQQQSCGYLGSLSLPHLLSPSEKAAFISWRGRTSFAGAQVL